MPLSMFESSVPVFVKTLTNLRSILAKAARHAEAKKIDEAALLQARLHPQVPADDCDRRAEFVHRKRHGARRRRTACRCRTAGI